MMGHDDLYDSASERAKFFSQTTDLRYVDAPTFEDGRACGVHAYDNHLFVLVNGLKIVSDVALVFSQSLKEAGKEIMKRNVMIPRHNYLGLWQSIEERTRLLKLVRAGALCEVAGDGNQIRFHLSDSL